MVNTPELEKAHMRAKIGIMSSPDSAFFSTLCFSLKHVWSTEVERAGTNGSEILLNPERYAQYSQQERVFTLLEETLHVGLMHILESRIGTRDKDKWNRAADEVVRNILHKRNFPIPTWASYDTKFADMPVEEVYKLLEEAEKGQGGNGSGVGSMGVAPDQKDLLPPKPNTDGNGDGEGQGQGQSQMSAAEIDQAMKHQIDDMLMKAKTQSQMSGDSPGSIPGNIDFYLEKLLNPKLSWRRLLRKTLTAFNRNNYSYRKPNRRYLPDYYLPTLYAEDMGDIAVIVDTSGSVSDDDFQKFVSETAAIMKQLKPSKITFIQFDTRIRCIDEIKSVKDLMKLKFTGRGGTVIDEVFDWIAENNPKAVVAFTDGYFRMPEPPKTTSNFVWVIYDNPSFVAPCGKLIHYEV